jgi:hypothetical protein
LVHPLTLIGQAENCDVLLNIEGVRPFHCAIAHGPDGFRLRDLGDGTGTFVNQEPVSTCQLRPGDRIGVGAFLFRIEFQPPPTATELHAERDALRIQAAAVAAQQAALTEEELRLRQEAVALERREEQLAAHLEQRRGQLLQLREQIKQERTALKSEREEIGRERDQAARDRKQARKERRRFVELRKRLKRRWKQHFATQEAVLRRRMEELAAHRTRLDAEADALRRGREEMEQKRLRFNGEVELGRRELQENWEELQLTQQRWEECLRHEQAERDRQVTGLTNDAYALAHEKQLWQHRRDALAREIEGLEARLRNQRHRLLDQEERLAHVEAKLQVRPLELGIPWATPLAEAHAIEPVEAPSVLVKLAGDLADQRGHLLEQWQKLLLVQAHWEQEREDVTSALERMAEKLHVRERRIVESERSLADLMADLEQRQERLARARGDLEARRTRLSVEQLAWEAERAASLDEVRSREAAAAGQLRRMENLRLRRIQRRQQEIEEVRAARTEAEQARQRYLSLWQECQQRRAELANEQRTLASQTVAFERFRLEYLGRLRNTPAAEKRLERLRRQSAVQLRAAERELIAEREAQTAEAARLEERGRLLTEREGALAARQQEWSHAEGMHQNEQVAGTIADERQRQELQRWQAQYQHAERQVTALRDEVEQLARLLLDDEVAASNQAA